MALRKIDLMHRLFGVCEGHACRECSNLVKGRYHDRILTKCEVYGLTRTGCCGCPISYKAVEDLEKIRPYEPNLVKAAWNIFGKSYEYRAMYNDYKKKRSALTDMVI